jgi:uncharacterized protein YecE (DUF72 family)
MAELRIGTSGWHYDHWRGPFYPEGMHSDAFLRFYAERFDAVEVNASFYHLPVEATLATWRDTVPDGFLFAAKASRYITHMKKLKDPAEPVDTFLTRMAALGDTLGPVLFQLPPRWHVDVERLEAFLGVLPAAVRPVLEFRDASWFDDRVYEALDRHGAAFCIYDLAGTESPHVVTGGLAYVRLHGSGAAYEGDYTPRMLSGWAGACTAWRRAGHDVHVYFDNDAHGYAPKDALLLKEMLDRG